MTLPITVAVTAVETGRTVGRAVLLPGQTLELGRRTISADDPRIHRLGLDPHVLGHREDSYVSAVVLRLAYMDLDGGKATLGWITKSINHPLTLRIEPSLEATGAPPIAESGQLLVTTSQAGGLSIYQLAGQRGFVRRLSVQLTATPAGRAMPRRHLDGTIGPRDMDALGHFLRDNWWGGPFLPDEDAPGLTWRECLRVSVRLSRSNVAGTLAEATQMHLNEAGFEASKNRVRNDWAKALNALAQALAGAHDDKFLTMLPISGLEDRVQRARNSTPALSPAPASRQPAGEPEVIALATVLRRVKWTEWS